MKMDYRLQNLIKRIVDRYFKHEIGLETAKSDEKIVYRYFTMAHESGLETAKILIKKDHGPLLHNDT